MSEREAQALEATAFPMRAHGVNLKRIEQKGGRKSFYSSSKL